MNRLGLTSGLTGLDSNVIVRYLVRDDERQYAQALKVMESLTEDAPGFITSVTLAEVHWVLNRRYGLARQECLSLIQRLVEIEVFEFDDAEGVVRALEFAKDGADFPDALINETFQQFGVTRTVSFDRRASEQLGWELLDA